MIVTLTGTPGTGKTSIAEELQKSFNVIDLTEFVKEHKLGEQKEEFEVDIPEMIEKLEEELKEDKDYLIEGHLSHHFPSDLCIVLRCQPDVLEERLTGRDYSEEKIEENIESEVLDVILQKAVEEQENVFEVDTTEREPEDTAERVREAIEKKEERYGRIDWSGFL